MMSATSLKTVTILALILVFATDALTPLGFAHGMLYTPILILTLFIGSRCWLFWVGFVSCILIPAGVLVSRATEVSPQVYWPNRLVSLVLLVATGILLDSLRGVLKSRRRTIDKLEAARLKLEQQQVLTNIASHLGRLGGWSYDAIEGTLSWSPEIFRIYGLSPDSPVPTLDEAFGFYDPDIQPVLRWHFERCLNEGIPFDFEIKVHTVAGTLIPVRVLGQSLYRNQEIVGVQGAFQDLSDYKKLEQSARYRQRLFSELTDSLPIIVWMANDQGEVDFLNQALAEYTGVTLESINLPMGWLDLLHPEDREPTMADWEQAVRKHQAYTTEFRIRRHDGHYGHFLVSAQPVDHPGEGSRWYGTATDMDEYRQLHEQLHQARRLEAIGQLTGGLAHDFNNLLTVVTGNAGLLRDQLSDRPQAREMADLVIQAANNGAKLTKSLLAFSRRQTLTPSRFDVASMIEAMEPLLRNSTGKAIEFKVTLASPLPSVVLDRAQLESAILNLTINARDAMPGGGTLHLSVYRAGQEALFGVKDPTATREWVVIEITDTGHGMNEATQAKVYEPFFTTKNPGQGTGLGLSQVFGFVTQSGGEVKLRSEPGSGTRVSLCFPVSP
ncbi:MAG TPA: PAS domain-containing protein [Saccharospirillum sp.]|nr:PAS domain-containing protein [Saccharospirillum sp.]